MNKGVKVFFICVSICLAVVVCALLVVNLLHKRNSANIDVVVPTASTVVVESTVAIKGEDITAPADDWANRPKDQLSESKGGLSVRVSEDAGGLRQDVMVTATIDYCESNGITGAVVIEESDYVDGLFTLSISTEEDAYTFTFRLEDYV